MVDLQLRAVDIDADPGLRIGLLPLRVPSPPPAAPGAADRLVDDLYPNGGFEITPTPSEIARGADWAARPPRWASLSGPPPRLDAARAHSGQRSLRLEPGARVATHLGWPLETRAPALVAVSVLAESPDGVALSVLAGPLGPAPPPELALWSGGIPGEWVDAALPLRAGTVAGLPPDAFLVVETGSAGAWLDDLVFAPAD